MEFAVGEVVKFRKEHPCGNNKWKILRVGADFRVQCTGCKRMIMLPRRKFEKNIKQKV
ncbi:DUF951 domain-containing protein [Halanaerocella petrolearia]